MQPEERLILLEKENAARKNQLEQLHIYRDAETNIRTILQAIPDIVFIMDRKGNYVDFKEGTGKVFITAVHGIVKGSNINDHNFEPEFIDKTLAHISRAIDTGITDFFSYELKFPDGELRYYESRAVKLNDHFALRIVRDFTDKEIAEKAIRHLYDEVHEQNRKLKEYTFMVSHNLRSPITNILGITSLFKADAFSEDEKEFYISQLIDQAQQLNHISRDMSLALHGSASQ